MHQEMSAKNTDANREERRNVLVARPLQAGNREKLQAIWKDPIRVINTVSPQVFIVEDLVSNNIHKIHSQRLRFYCDALLAVTHELVTKIKHDGGLFAVARLKEHIFSNWRWEFLVQWLRFNTISLIDKQWPLPPSQVGSV